MKEPDLNLSTSPGDEVKTTTCYMCACRCGIKVHIKDGRIRYIEGNKDHPVNRGVLCGKGSAGIMQQYSPAKLRKPLTCIKLASAAVPLDLLFTAHGLSRSTALLQVAQDGAPLLMLCGQLQSPGNFIRTHHDGGHTDCAGCNGEGAAV